MIGLLESRWTHKLLGLLYVGCEGQDGGGLVPSRTMKISFLSAHILLVSGLLAVSPAVGFAGDAPEPATISTSGSAEIRVAADLADLYFDVNVRHADLATARKKQAERANKVLAALRDSGMEDKDLQTSQVNVTATYAENRHGETATVNYYDVTQGVYCTLHDVKKVADLTTAVLTAGATAVHEASLRTSELRKHRDEARAQAARAAREKAVAIAAELGAKVGKPYKVTESIGDSRTNNFSANAVTTAAAPASEERDEPRGVFAPGLLTISAEVNVTFYLE